MFPAPRNLPGCAVDEANTSRILDPNAIGGPYSWIAPGRWSIAARERWGLRHAGLQRPADAAAEASKIVFPTIVDILVGIGCAE
jgi:hypothetical protein